MRIITKRKVITTNSVNNYSNIDGTSNSNQVLHFQKWINKAHPELGGKISEDGVFKVNDEFLYKTYGAEYEKAAAALANTLSKVFGYGIMVNPVGMKETDPNYIKGGLTADKDWGRNYKPLSKPAEKKPAEKKPVEEIKKPKLTNLQLGLIIGGGAAVLITIIVLIAKK
jgi:hypothetical protein